MKIQPGENKIRILSKPIFGWEDWDEINGEKKPVRSKYTTKPPIPIHESKPPKHFWAMVVWDYKDEKIKILQITQAMIRNRLMELTADEDWGAPYFYDIKITKTGEGNMTKYAVTPVSHKKVSEAVRTAFYEKPVRLEALYTNGDPFACDSGVDGIFSEDDLKEAPSVRSVKEDPLADMPWNEAERLTPFDELKKHLEADKLDTDYLQEFLQEISKRQKKDVEKIISNILLDGRVIAEFKKLYIKALEQRIPI